MLRCGVNVEILSSIYHLVRDACRAPSNIFGFGIWTHHIRPMIDTAIHLAPAHGADMEMLLLCVLLHDYAAVLDEEFIAEHHVHGANQATTLLSARDYAADRIAIIGDAILAHRGSKPQDKTTKEAACLADCDAISHIQQFPSLYRAIYSDESHSIDDGARWVKEKLERDWIKLSSIGRDYIRNTYTSLIAAIKSIESFSVADEEPVWEQSRLPPRFTASSPNGELHHSRSMNLR